MSNHILAIRPISMTKNDYKRHMCLRTGLRVNLGRVDRGSV